MKIRIGSRGSVLARWQAEHVQGRLRGHGHEVEIVIITTTGDRVLDRRLEAVGGKGAFLKEIEEALLAGEVDLAVHSLKDVPTELPAGLRLVAMLERADARDVLLSAGPGLMALPSGARVGTTSLRRRAQVLALRPDLVVQDLRGNVDTRIRRLREGAFDAILLARAGLARLGRADEATEVLDPNVLLPAPGQGAIALECREDDPRTAEAVAPLHHEPTGRAVAAERAFLAALHGGCNVPLGAHAVAEDGGLWLRGLVAREDGSALVRGDARGAEPLEVGRALASVLLARGAGELLRPWSAARLAGWRVLVTRQPEQAAGVSEALAREGARVIEVPLIEIAPPADPEPLREAVQRLADYDWLVFTSANAVRAFAAALGSRPLPGGLRVASVGPSTSEVVSSALGAPVSLAPASDFRAEGLVGAFADHDVDGRRVLLPASARARDAVAAGLGNRGARVDVVPSYRTLTPPDAPERLAAALRSGVDVVLLASPSAVEGFVSSSPPGAAWPPAIAIGPVTEQAAREAGLEVAGVGGAAGPEGIVDLLAGLTRPR